MASHEDDIAIALVPVAAMVPQRKPNIDLLEDSSDVAEYARWELHMFPSCLALAWLRGNSMFFDLFIGELAKQLYDSMLNGLDSTELLTKMYNAERAVYVEYLHRHGAVDCDTEFLQAFESIWAMVNEKDRRLLRVLWISDCLYLYIESFLIARTASSSIAIKPIFVTARNPIQIKHEVQTLSKDHTFDAVFYSLVSYGFHRSYAQFRDPKKVMSQSLNADSVIDEAISDTDAISQAISENFDCPVYVHNSALLVRRNEQVRRIAALFFYSSCVQQSSNSDQCMAKKHSDIVYVESILRTIKLVVCGLEGTLWKELYGEGVVQPLFDRQEILKRLKSKGVILSINSKSQPPNVKWDESVLNMDDFICPQINGLPKAQNMRTIIENLNLKPKNIYFIGDRGNVREIIGKTYPRYIPARCQFGRCLALA